MQFKKTFLGGGEGDGAESNAIKNDTWDCVGCVGEGGFSQVHI